MNKIESRHRLIRSIISERRIHTQQELQEALEANGVLVTQSTLSRDVKSLNLVKINEGIFLLCHEHHRSFPLGKTPADVYGRCLSYVTARSKPGRCKNSSRSGQSFGAILDALELQEIVATICGDDVCLVICEDNQGALDCFEKLKEFTPPFFFSK